MCVVWLVNFRALLKFMDGDSTVYPVVGTPRLFLLGWFTDPKDTLSALGSRRGWIVSLGCVSLGRRMGKETGPHPSSDG